MTRKEPSPQRQRIGAKLSISMLLIGVGLIAICVAVRNYWGANSANANPAPRSIPQASAPRPAGPTASRPVASQTAPQLPSLMATVNGEEISQDQLAHECLKHFGKDVLEHLVNKYLIRQECQRRNIKVSQADVNGEIERMATRFSLPVDQWLKMLEQERGINARQYANDIIWPMLAIRALAGDRLQVTQQELTEQYESNYGPSVQARLIVCDDQRTANRVRAQAAADPASFSKLAKQESIDVASASAGGMIQPIRKHTGHKEIETVAFAMKEGDISPVISAGGQFAILKCEGHLPARNVPVEQVKSGLVETIHQNKLRIVSTKIRSQLQENSEVENILNNSEARRRMPGVAAVINGQRITIRELAELCIDRHGKEVLEGTINRRLLEQACRRQNITISDADLDAEIALAASRYMRLKPDGSPDVDTWLDITSQEQGVSVAAFRNTSVWPTVALKKLVGKKVEVTEEDLRRGYEANFGPRAQCLAIVLNNLRRARDVWSKASKHPTPEFFGDLAEEYSIESSSRALRGEVPPLQKHSRQSKLTEVAFGLAPGELSSIVQTGPEQYVILFSLGQTKPIHVEFKEVRDEIHADLYEKRQLQAMSEYFQQLQDSATIDNFLANTSQSPRNVQAASHAAPVHSRK